MKINLKDIFSIDGFKQQNDLNSIITIYNTENYALSDLDIYLSFETQTVRDYILTPDPNTLKPKFSLVIYDTFGRTAPIPPFDLQYGNSGESSTNPITLNKTKGLFKDIKFYFKNQDYIMLLGASRASNPDKEFNWIESNTQQIRNSDGNLIDDCINIHLIDNSGTTNSYFGFGGSDGITEYDGFGGSVVKDKTTNSILKDGISSALDNRLLTSTDYPTYQERVLKDIPKFENAFWTPVEGYGGQSISDLMSSITLVIVPSVYSRFPSVYPDSFNLGLGYGTSGYGNLTTEDSTPVGFGGHIKITDLDSDIAKGNLNGIKY